MKVLKSRTGSTMILFAMSFTLIAAATALVIDVGSTLFEKNRISNACDAAALASAAELQSHPENAESVARNYLQANGVDLNTATVKISIEGRSIEVSVTETVKYTFAKIIGFQSGVVNATAKAGLEAITKMSGGVRPFAIVNQELVYGQNYILKEGAGGGSTGNYDLLALGGKGANIVSYNIVNGYDGTLAVGDQISTQPGNMAGPVTSSVESLIYQDSESTFEQYDVNSPRIITVLVVDTINVCGSKPVTICGFASFFLEEVSGCGGQTEIVGKFIKTVGVGETGPSQTDYGLLAIRLQK